MFACVNTPVSNTVFFNYNFCNFVTEDSSKPYQRSENQPRR